MHSMARVRFSVSVHGGSALLLQAVRAALQFELGCLLWNMDALLAVAGDEQLLSSCAVCTPLQQQRLQQQHPSREQAAARRAAAMQPGDSWQAAVQLAVADACSRLLPVGGQQHAAALRQALAPGQPSLDAAWTTSGRVHADCVRRAAAIAAGVSLQAMLLPPDAWAKRCILAWPWHPLALQDSC